MYRYLICICFFALSISTGFAQGGAKVSVGLTNINQDFLQTENQYSGWNIRLSARLGRGVWFFSPELNYVNNNILPTEGRKPFKKDVRIHTLKVPVGIGLKFKTLPFQKVFVKGGIIGSYVLIIEENDSTDFNDIVDQYAGYFATVGYDFHWFTIDYRYEKSIIDNYFKIPDSKLAFHSVTLGINF